jgi:DNA-directed RNA polymerase subunit M/transcription elongation factor TFIIS
MIKCPQCGSYLFVVAEDTTVTYQCKIRGDEIVGIPYAITEDEAKNTRLRCKKCNHEWPVPETKKVVWY